MIDCRSSSSLLNISSSNKVLNFSGDRLNFFNSPLILIIIWEYDVISIPEIPFLIDLNAPIVNPLPIFNNVPPGFSFLGLTLFPPNFLDAGIYTI